MNTSFYRKIEKNVFLVNIKVKAGAKENKLLSIENNTLFMQIEARALNGMANREIVIFLSSVFEIKKSCCSIVHGHKTREKIVRVEKDVSSLSLSTELQSSIHP
eukprot:GHVN01074783.1.p1 GENE.GHVN01074783.1~~GHVN01074783.1.p1  ORF type:complete len:104 (+),score=10.24 GHVN01074783.1:204-515(+)